MFVTKRCTTRNFKPLIYQRNKALQATTTFQTKENNVAKETSFPFTFLHIIPYTQITIDVVGLALRSTPSADDLLVRDLIISRILTFKTLEENYMY